VLIDGLGMSLAAQLATQPLVLLHFGQLSLVSPLANLLAAPLVAPAMLTSAAALAVSGAASAGLPDLVVAPFALAAAFVLGGLIAVAHVCASLPLAAWPCRRRSTCWLRSGRCRRRPCCAGDRWHQSIQSAQSRPNCANATQAPLERAAAAAGLLPRQPRLAPCWSARWSPAQGPTAVCT
jgi:hypothetical protein